MKRVTGAGLVEQEVHAFDLHGMQELNVSVQECTEEMVGISAELDENCN